MCRSRTALQNVVHMPVPSTLSLMQGPGCVAIKVITVCFQPQGYHEGPDCSDFVQVFNAHGLRHPAEVGAMQGRSFVPNDVHLGGPSPGFVLLTGPNMGGKSTLLRQVSHPAMPRTTIGPDSITLRVFDCVTPSKTATDLMNRVDGHAQCECIQAQLSMPCRATMLTRQSSEGSKAAPWRQCLKGQAFKHWPPQFLLILSI